MIRKSIYMVCLSAALVCGACNDWLTVVPETALVADNLFETDEGVLKALDGAYVLVARDIYSPTGYSGSGFSEPLACTFTSTIRELANHVYNIDNTQFGKSFDMVFKAYYKVIATLNPLIEGCGKNVGILKKEYHNIVKGEALAMRASLHLDLIRFWGPMPSRVDGAMGYLPYVTKNSSDNYEYHTFERYMQLLIADLDEAEKLLAESDPILTYPANGGTEYTGEWKDRQSHFNYYGVLGLQARARLWMGDKEGAVRYAKMVIDAKNEDGTPKFTLVTKETFEEPTFYMEHLCGVYQGHFDYQQTGFTNIPRNNTFYNENYTTFTSDLFDGNANDARYKLQWTSILVMQMGPTRIYYPVSQKYWYIHPGVTGSKKNMPVVRLAEMYLTIMEAGTLSEANGAYETLRVSRDVPYEPLVESDRTGMGKVLMEWLRELAVEGQNFFTYKRYAVERMLWQPVGSADCGEAQYVLPLPPSEYKTR